MESVIRNVRDLPSDERRVLEDVLGQKLRENQQIILQVITLEALPGGKPTPQGWAGQLPDWCDVYRGLDDSEIAGIEKVILDRADLTRPAE